MLVGTDNHLTLPHPPTNPEEHKRSWQGQTTISHWAFTLSMYAAMYITHAYGSRMYSRSILALHTLITSGLYVLIQDSDGFLFMTTLFPVEHILSPHRYMSHDTPAFNNSSCMLMSSGVSLSSRTSLTAARAFTMCSSRSSGCVVAVDCRAVTVSELGVQG